MLQHDELYHYGILGMKWGRRKDPRNLTVTRVHGNSEEYDLYKAGKISREEFIKRTAEGNRQMIEETKKNPELQAYLKGEKIPRRTYREAKKDAEEFTRAKMFYGEGAGNRRKLINATIAAKAKKDPYYKQLLDRYIEETDFAKRADQARGERKRKDVKKEVGKTARGIKNLVMGTGASVGMTAAVLYGGYRVWQNNPQVRATVKRVGGQRMKDIQRIYNAAKLKGMGF